MSVDVVIAARNEAARLEDVLTAFRYADGVGQVIVAANGCTDATADVARRFGATVHELAAGDKGSAMAAGLHSVQTDQVLFCDGDLSGLTRWHAEGLLEAPPADGQVVGVTPAFAPLGRLPSISGVRRLPVGLARSVGLRGAGWRAETLLNVAVARAGLPWRHFMLRGVSNPARPNPVEWVQVAATMAAFAPELAAYTLHPGGRAHPA